MNNREKVLLALVFSVLGVGIGATLVQKYIIQKFRTLDTTIAKKQQDLKEMDALRNMARVQAGRWAHVVKETLATDPTLARTRMVNELTAVGNKHALSALRVVPGGEVKPNRLGIVPMTFNIDGEATLDKIVSFLYDLHNLPFLARTDTVRLTPLTGTKDGPRRIRLNVKGVTMVLPISPLARDATTAVLEPGKRKDVIRTEWDNEHEYAVAIADRKIFEPYTAPVVVIPPHGPDKPVGTQPVEKGPDPVRVVETRKFDSDRSTLKVTGLIGTPDTQEVVLTGAGNTRRIKKLGEPFDGGTLVYVHPEGAVVVYKDEKSGKDEIDFYPLGEMMSAMKVLTEEVNPEAFAIVSEMQKGMASASPAAKNKGG